MRRLLGRLRRRVERLARVLRGRRRHRAIASSRAVRGGVAVFYGQDRIPTLDEPAHGGAVKFQQLQREFPNEPRAFNVLYLGSSNRPSDSSALIRLARRRHATIVLNQDGVAYPGWHGSGWEQANVPLAEMLHAADHVFFQSEFCKRSSDRFLGEIDGSWEVLHNPVDTERFAPAERSPRPLTLLLGGNQYQRYRFERGLRAFELVSQAQPDARMLVTGRISWNPDRRLAEREARELLGSSTAAGRVELVGPFTQREAPMLYRRADVLLHTKYNDPCPTVVLEAMASGLPVVYSDSGGTPELVGDAGVGVPTPLDWERDHPPDPEALAAAVLRVTAQLEEYSSAARARAVERFDASHWIERHRALFAELSE
jgi:glycosyltransferase involved in cell wall biosynthesis